LFYFFCCQIILHLKQIRFILFFLFCVFSAQTAFSFNNEDEKNAKAKTEHYIKYVYNKINFKKHNKISYEAFRNGFYGYLNLKESGRIKYNATLSICDFSLSSNKNRLWVFDIINKKVLFNTLVAHGSGTGEEFATQFSNVENSHQSSLGFYITAEIYTGDNGYSMRLDGVDGNWNNQARNRDIVVHGADYVSKEFAAANERLGRSHGCPALHRELTEPIINKIADRQVLYIHYPSKQYQKTSYWLSNGVAHLPDEASIAEMYYNLEAKNKATSDSISNNTTDKIIPQVENNISTPKEKVIPAAISTPKQEQIPAPTVPSTKSQAPAPAPAREKEFLYIK
jgi:hypothetical protein